jgi:RNA polymerase sigma-70 factor (sigma-E family)
MMTTSSNRNPEFELFVRRFRPALRLSALTMTGDWYAAEDLVQEALIIVHRRWDDVEPAARSSYVRTVMARLLAHERTSPRWQRESILDVLPEPRRCEEEKDEEVADRLVIRDALARLPARQRDAVHLRYWGGLSTNEVARILNVPIGTVRSDLSRAAGGLRMALLPSFPGRLTGPGS